MKFTHPEHQPLHYIGGTTVPDQRKRQHLEALKAGKHPNYKVREAYKLCSEPEFIIIHQEDAPTAEIAAKIENRFIEEYIVGHGPCCCNLTCAIPNDYRKAFPYGLPKVGWEA